MTTFLTGNKLNTELENIFEKASEYLFLISPFIKLHERYASILVNTRDSHGLFLKICTIKFGV
jgi:hypothetical protein